MNIIYIFMFTGLGLILGTFATLTALILFSIKETSEIDIDINPKWR